MNKILKAAKNLIKNPYLLYPYMGSLGLLNWLPDAAYLKGCFRAHMGYKLDLENPKTFNEKLQWLKLYDRNPAYTQMVDKYAVREYIKNRIGEEYLIPLLGVVVRGRICCDIYVADVTYIDYGASYEDI